MFLRKTSSFWSVIVSCPFLILLFSNIASSERLLVDYLGMVVIPCKSRTFNPPTPSEFFEIYTIGIYHWEEKKSKISAHNSNSFKSYGILKFEQKCPISSSHSPLWITPMYLFLNISSSTGAKWLKIGTWLILRVLNSNVKRNWPVSNVLLVIFWF